MKMVRSSWFRTFVALACTVCAIYVFHWCSLLIVSELELVDIMASNFVYGALHDSAINFLSFLLGGFIANKRFCVSALLLALLLHYISLASWASWSGTAFAETFAEHGFSHIMFTCIAVLGWFVGSVVFSRLQSRSHVVAT
jgi:hypothetical protein